ncbi:MAG: YggS family pyridoxal phosphate-dependent enzyme [Oligoflexus sp.]
MGTNNSDINELQELEKRFAAIKETIAGCPRFNPEQEVELIVVSKGQNVEKIRRFHQLGQKRFGENYLQELQSKSEALRDLPIEWVFIGHLQSNKIKKIVEYAAEIQTVASLKHAAAIAQAARTFGRTPYPIYLAINADEEEGKNGVNFAELLPLYEQIAQQFADELHVMGIMAVPSADYTHYADDAEVPAIYQKLRRVADQIGEAKLSLGMSGDLKIAIRAGSNLVRIGTALMGERSQNTRLKP